MSVLAVNFKCTFCSKTFKRKSWYERHLCERKKRFIEANNITTIKAHRLFNHWQIRTGLTRGGKGKNLDKFCKSPFYNTFINLANFCSEHHIATPYKYVDWLVENRIPEYRWLWKTNFLEYHMYLNVYEDPEVQAINSCKHIKNWCADNDITSPQDFFNSIDTVSTLEMIKQNRLSPWLLFGYTPCMEHLTIRILESDLIHELNEHINIQHWVGKTEDGDSVNMINTVCDKMLNELNLILISL